MKLTETVLKAINNKTTRRKLSEALDCTEQTIIRYLKENDDNLTKAAALAVIREDTGLEDSQILEVEEVSRG